MSNINFDKIIPLKKREKNQLSQEYNESVKVFEDVGTELYELLKRKEQYEEQIEQQAGKGISIYQLQNHSLYIEQLDQMIVRVQMRVQQARNRMERKKQQLLNSNIENKKYEKMQEKSIESTQALEKMAENKLLDEISLQQYMNRRN